MRDVVVPNLERTSAGAVMHREMICCSPSTPLRQVAARMARMRIHAVVVFDVADEGEGDWRLIDDLDLMGAVARGLGTAGEAALHPPTIGPDDDLGAAPRRVG
jgi:signal-transduction protein with cAMP-binding, CBS, and nucleotidyltransferase domain